jgi:perosamine synthetase
MAYTIPVSRPHLWGDEASHVQEALSEGWISSRGRFIDELEQCFAAALNMPHAVSVSNGTVALHLALDVLGIGEGDEVIVPDFSMISPILAALYCRARPVPVDADVTWNIDPSRIEEAIGPRTRAIIVVHTYGHPADMAPILEIARRRGLHVIEDCAEALGATVREQMVGTFGDIACFSFYANKAMTTGEGGMLVMRDAALRDRARWKRDLCFGVDDEARFTHEEIGYNYRLTNLQAAVGIAQLRHLDEVTARKRAIAARYRAALSNLPGMTLPPESPWAVNVYWVFGVLVEEELGVERATLQRHLRACGIETRRFFTPVHAQPIAQVSCDAPRFPQATRLAQRGFYLPSYIGLLDEEIDRVVAHLRSACPGRG